MSSSTSSPSSSTLELPVYTTLLLSYSEHVATISFNRPQRKNALALITYAELSSALSFCSNSSDVHVVVLTGVDSTGSAGSFYSSGNDLMNFFDAPSSDVGTMAREGSARVRDFVAAFIDFDKPLIAAVNGPAIGVACTTLALADVVYASENAWFSTPFSSIAQCPEGCSSYTFPLILGSSLANEVLLAGRILTAQEALARGLVSRVWKQGEFRTHVEKHAKQLAALPSHSVQQAKSLLRSRHHAALHAANAAECTALEKLFKDPRCAEAVMKFLNENANKKKPQAKL